MIMIETEIERWKAQYRDEVRKAIEPIQLYRMADKPFD